MPHRITTALVVALTALTVASTGATTAEAVPAATATTAGVLPATAGAHGAHGERVLARAVRVLGGTASTTPTAATGRRVDATMALRDLFLARPALDDDADRSDLRQADTLLARPTDGSRDPYGDGYSVPSVSRCSAHVCLHWVNSTDDQPSSQAWVRTTLDTMEQVWHHHVTRFGYRAPPSDGSRGGNAKFDVYLKNLGSQGLYGYCAPERRVAGEPRAASSFCVLDNDFSRAEFHTAPIKALMVTAAHEFFHAIQFGYDFREDPWILESTATWMEERFADDVNDNRQYLPYGQAGISSAPLDIFDSAGFNQYGNWVFFEYLSERFGNRIVRDIWDHLGDGRSGKAYSIQGVKQVLAKHGGIASVYAAFAAANTVPGRSYEEGAHFPQPRADAKKELRKKKPSWTYTTTLQHLAAKTVVIRSNPSLGKKYRLQVVVNAPSRPTGPGAFLITHATDGKLVRHPIELNAGGYAKVDVVLDHHQTSFVTVTVSNASTRYTCHRSTSYSCQGRPQDNNLPFVIKAHAHT